jgi:hypothetical protein
MNPLKTQAIRDWPIPTHKKDLQSFLGFMNYYRRFIKNFLEIALPLDRLVGDVPWEWTTDCQSAYETLKSLVASDVTLAMPSDDGKYRVECDPSYYALGSILSQQQPDEMWRPVAFASWTMSPAQRNYQVYDKEFLAIMHSLTEWRKYLLGTKHTVEVITDHRNLEYYRKPQNLTCQQADLVSQLQEYDLELKHRPGRLHGKADFLSQPLNTDKGEQDNKQIIGIPDKFWSTTNTFSADNSVTL